MSVDDVPDIRLSGLTKRYGDVVALFVILVSVIPVYVASRLAGGAGIAAERGGVAAAAAAQK